MERGGLGALSDGICMEKTHTPCPVDRKTPAKTLPFPYSVCGRYKNVYSPGYSTLAIIPGMTMMKRGRILMNPAMRVAAWACDKLLAASALCTITYKKKCIPLYDIVIENWLWNITSDSGENQEIDLNNFYYRQQTKLQEGNVFAHVCLPSHNVIGHTNPLPYSPEADHHRMLWNTVNKREVPILLECILVFMQFSAKSCQIIGFYSNIRDWRTPSGNYWVRHWVLLSHAMIVAFKLDFKCPFQMQSQIKVFTV